jgi:hypothetical protein
MDLVNEHNRNRIVLIKPARLAGLSAFACLLPGTAWADQIVLKDGDRITGSILKKDGATIAIKSKNFGEVTLKWADIATIRADEPLNVVLAGDREVKGTISTHDGRIVVGAPGAAQTVQPSDIIALRNDAEQRAYERFMNPGLFDLWTITGSIDIAGIKGNAESSTLTTPLNFVRASNTSRTTAYFNSIRSTATVNGVSAKTAQAVRGAGVTTAISPRKSSSTVLTITSTTDSRRSIFASCLAAAWGTGSGAARLARLTWSVESLGTGRNSARKPPRCRSRETPRKPIGAKIQLQAEHSYNRGAGLPHVQQFVERW